MPDTFINGIALCEEFWHDVARSIFLRHFPNLSYTTALVGYGSDVLGYDDAVSTDHMWGPRFYLFLDESGIARKNDIMDVFEEHLPYDYKGYPVNFSEPDSIGVRQAKPISAGKVKPLVFIHTLRDYVNGYLGKYPQDGLDALDWLCMSENKLLSLTSGKVFEDMLGLCDIRESIAFYPDDVHLYLIASQWSLIAEEQAFVKRCAVRGDDVGSRIVCMRIIERIMRLWFLYAGRYAPYSKWFGTAFMRHCPDEQLKQALSAAASALDISKRETCLVEAQAVIGELHNRSGITEPLDLAVQSYYGRDIKVIFADRFADKVKERLVGSPLASLPLIGTSSQIGNLCVLNDDPDTGFTAQRAMLERLCGF